MMALRRLNPPPRRRARIVSGAKESAGDKLARELRANVEARFSSNPILPQATNPSPLLTPLAVVQVVCDALQLSDWPEEDAGLLKSFDFSLPADAENIPLGSMPAVSERTVRLWGEANEYWCGVEEYIAKMKASDAVKVLLGCQAWSRCSDVVFTNSKGDRVVVAVKVVPAHGGRRITRTFCLKRVDSGAAKGCFYITGLRNGDYANID